MVYIVSYVIGGLIVLMLYGKVSTIASLIIATIIGGLIGYINGIMQRKKAEREYYEWLKSTGFINVK